VHPAAGRVADRAAPPDRRAATPVAARRPAPDRRRPHGIVESTNDHHYPWDMTTPPPSSPPSGPAHRAADGRPAAGALLRWDRIGLGVRLGYNPWHPPAIRSYLHAGRELVRAGTLPDEAVQRRTLSLLLRTAEDAALPWGWRVACHEHLVFPLAKLRSLVQPGATPDLATIEERVEEVGRRLFEAVIRAQGGTP